MLQKKSLLRNYDFANQQHNLKFFLYVVLKYLILWIVNKMKKSFKQRGFFLSGPASTPPPPPLSGLATSGGTFLCGLPKILYKLGQKFLDIQYT